MKGKKQPHSGLPADLQGHDVGLGAALHGARPRDPARAQGQAYPRYQLPPTCHREPPVSGNGPRALWSAS